MSDILCKQCYQFNDEWKAVVTMAFGIIITPHILRKMSHRTWRHKILCSNNEVQHTDALDIRFVDG